MTATTERPILEVSNLSVELGRRTVLDSVSFELARGEALALVGESGSGKTVTARTVLGLLGNIGGTVTSGEALFDGESVLGLSNRAWSRLRGRQVALVPQASLSSLDPIARIGAQLKETIRALDPNADVMERSVELLEQVKLPRASQLLRNYPHELSGGMRQRVMIALALAGRPRLIVADEPTTALDVTVQAGILDLLTELRRETGMSLLLIAHDLAVVERVAERVAVMRAGRILESGPSSVMLSSPSNEYTQALLAARPESSRPGEMLAVLDRVTGQLMMPAPPLPSVVPFESSRIRVELRDAEVVYRGASAPALAPFSLVIEPGSAVGIVGESGSGKTTLGRVIVGSIAPTSGQVLFDGRSWHDVKPSDPLRASVQMIFQDPYGSLTPWLTPRQTVGQVVRQWEHVSTAESLARAADNHREVGLPEETFDRLPSQMSGGQCQRVGIARALATRPSILIADEPTSSLDISSQAQILNLLLSLRATRGLCLVLISHDLAVVRHMTDSTIVMRDGVVVESGPSEMIFNSPHEEYTRRLAASTPTLTKKFSPTTAVEGH
jgi:peptide/nickel transport system ATP-binding protein